MWVALMSVGQFVVWHSRATTPEETRRATSTDLGPPPMPINGVTFLCLYLVAFPMLLWTSAALPFLGLMVVFAPVTLLLILAVPLLLIFLPVEIVGWISKRIRYAIDPKASFGFDPVSDSGAQELQLKALATLVFMFVATSTTMVGFFFHPGQYFWTLGTLLRSLVADLSFSFKFKLTVVFAWPFDLPSISQIQLALTAGLIALKYLGVAFVFLSKHGFGDAFADSINGLLVDLPSKVINLSVFAIAKVTANVQQALSLRRGALPDYPAKDANASGEENAKKKQTDYPPQDAPGEENANEEETDYPAKDANAPEEGDAKEKKKNDNERSAAWISLNKLVGNRFASLFAGKRWTRLKLDLRDGADDDIVKARETLLHVSVLYSSTSQTLVKRALTHSFILPPADGRL